MTEAATAVPRGGPKVIRGNEAPSYAPANHSGTRNRRLIAPGTVGARGLEVVLGEIVPEGVAHRHLHPELEQVCYLLEGRLRIETPDGTAELEPGDCCYFAPGEPHRVVATGPTAARLLVIYAPPYGEDPGRTVVLDGRTEEGG
jgi:quercetin dioxygenase-like cupin family protein